MSLCQFFAVSKSCPPDNIFSARGSGNYLARFLKGRRKSSALFQQNFSRLTLLKKRNKNLKRTCSVYLGPDYSNKEIFSTLKKYNLHFNKPNNLSNYVANKLAQGYLVSWFQDKMEFSHRALGNRSILADPRKKQMQNKGKNKCKKHANFYV